MWLTRTPFFSMMSVRCRSSSVSVGDSRSSWPAWLMAPTGLRISCAMLALSRPSAASFDCWTRSAITLVSSRKISTGPAPLSDKRDEVRPDDGAAVRGDDFADVVAAVRDLAAPGLQQVGEARRHGWPARRPAPPAPPFSSCAAVSLIRRTRSRLVDDQDALAQVLHDELVQLVEVRQVDLALLGQRLALAQPRARTGRASSVIANRLAPVRPVIRKSRPRTLALQERNGCLDQQGERDDRRAAAAHSAARRMVAAPPVGSTSRVARPLVMPPLAWISTPKTIASTISWSSACHSAAGHAALDRLDADQRRMRSRRR